MNLHDLFSVVFLLLNVAIASFIVHANAQSDASREKHCKDMDRYIEQSKVNREAWERIYQELRELNEYRRAVVISKEPLQ